jgi:phospholipid/cholesterol/gamma-HCH transport system permease protein
MLAAGVVALLPQQPGGHHRILCGYVFSVFVQDVNPGAVAAGITQLTRVYPGDHLLHQGRLFGLIAGLIACYRGLTISARRQGRR